MKQGMESHRRHPTWTDFAGVLATHLPLEGFIQKTGSAIKLRYENLQIHQTWAR